MLSFKHLFALVTLAAAVAVGSQWAAPAAGSPADLNRPLIVATATPTPVLRFLPLVSQQFDAASTATPTPTTTATPTPTNTPTTTATATPTSTPTSTPTATPTIAADPYEPNNTSDQATFVGNIANGDSPETISGNIHSFTDSDWYRVYAVDSTTFCPFVGEVFTLQIDLTNIPAGRDYDLFVYFTPGGVADGYSQNSGNANERVMVTWDGTWGANNGESVYAHVLRYSGEPSAQGYQLSFKLTEVCD